MKIKDNSIEIHGGKLHMGMPYSEAHDILKNSIYTSRLDEISGRGHIVLKDIVFYGLKGKCTIYFQGGCLERIGIVPEWNLYSLVDADNRRLPIDAAVEKVAMLSEMGLEMEFGAPDEVSEYGNKVFKSGELTVVTSISRSGDNYSVIIY